MRGRTWMTKTKDMIEKVWWAIPPVIIVFVFYPIFITIADGRYSLGKCVFWLQYLFLSPIGRIYVVCTFGFMGIGYYVTRGKTLALRVAVPMILSVIGFFAGIFMALIIVGSEGAY
jgi:hypothetical protein